MNDKRKAPFQLLAGPILRRCETERVCIWVAADAPIRIRGEIFLAEALISSTPRSSASPLGIGETDSLAFGSRLHVALVQIRPIPPNPNTSPSNPALFPTNRLLAYDLEITTANLSKGFHLGELFGLSLAYPPFMLPTFFLKSSGEVNILHGSCRKLHGPGGDALALGDILLRLHAKDPNKRPSALFLTGDQIYADDVAGPIIEPLAKLGSDLLGWYEQIPTPNGGAIPVRALHCGARGRLLNGFFTSTAMENHLLGFGDYAAMYLLAWNEVNWPAKLDLAPSCQSNSPESWSKEIASLEQTRQALPAVRRLLANIPTYMIMDDHEITDDWNLNKDWEEKVYKSPTGKRIVANGLAAYWLFQAWGNDPDRFGEDFYKPILNYLANKGSQTENYEKTLLSYHCWSFVSPTYPPAIFLDTRTRRGFDKHNTKGPPFLLGIEALVDFVRVAQQINSQVLLIISAAPVFDIEKAESYIESKGKEDPAEYDLERWHANLMSYYTMLEAIHNLQPEACVILSGDVHYAYAISAVFINQGRATPFTQFTSSSLHNEPDLKQKIGLLLAKKYTSLPKEIWNRPVRASKKPEEDTDLSKPPVVLRYGEGREIGIRETADSIEIRMLLSDDTEHDVPYVTSETNLGHLLIADSRATLEFYTLEKNGRKPSVKKISVPLNPWSTGKFRR